MPPGGFLSFLGAGGKIGDPVGTQVPSAEVRKAQGGIGPIYPHPLLTHLQSGKTVRLSQEARWDCSGENVKWCVSTFS